MSYSIKQLSDQGWGIYADEKLLATLGSHDKCLKLLKLLQTSKTLIAKQNRVAALLSKQAA